MHPPTARQWPPPLDQWVVLLAIGLLILGERLPEVIRASIEAIRAFC